MATSVVPHMAADVGSSVCHNPCLQAAESSQDGKEENGSLCMFTSSSNGSCLTRGQSLSPAYQFDYSKFDTESRQTFSDSLKPPDKDGNQSKSYVDQTRTAQYGSTVFDKNLKDSVYQQRSNADHFSLESLMDNSCDSYKKASTSAYDNTSDNKWDYRKDYSHPTNTSRGYETTKQKNDHFPDYDLRSADVKPTLQTFDFDMMKQTYNFDNETKHAGDKETDTAKTTLPSRQSYNFEGSDLALRLRTSVQSNFLSSEFRQISSSKPEESKYESSGALRTIEEILKQYGISDNTPCRSVTFDDADNKMAASSQMGHTNKSQNSEASVTRTAGSSSLDKDTANLFPATANTNMNTSFRSDPPKTSSYLDSKRVTAAGSGFTGNISQNEQPSYKSQSSLDNDPLKKLGLYSGSTNLRMFDYGKSMPFTNDNPRSSTKTFSAMDSKQFENNLDITKFQGPQVDLMTSAFGADKGSPLDAMKTLGSATDALEYSMLNERQRLRKLNTMISATPLNYSSVELPRSLRAQYMSPERCYSTLRSSDITGQRGVYSSSTSSGSHKNSMAGKVGQRVSSTAFSKSTSVPGSGVLGLQGTGKHCSSIDVRAPYWPYNSKQDYNTQYNNVYNPQLLEKNVHKKTISKNQKQGNNKKECPFKNKKSASDNSYNNDDDIPPFYHHSATGINFLSSSARGDKNSAAERRRYSTKSEMKMSVGGRKNSAYNQGKNVGGIYDEFDFVKDLNRMWQETVFGTSSAAKLAPSHRQQQKYTPYQPLPSSQNKKDDKAGCPLGKKEMFTSDYLQSSAKKSESSWIVGDSTAIAGKHYGYDCSLKPAQKVRSQCSVTPQRSSHAQNKVSVSSTIKKKSTVPSMLLTKQATTAPKSILKQPSNKASSNNRPHSAMAASSKSFTQSAYHLPYHLVRGFSPVDLQKTGRSQTSASLKKKEPSTKRKPASRTSATPRLVRHM